MPSGVSDPRGFLRGLFDTAVAAADPLVRVPEFLPPAPRGRVFVVGAGKASARMAQAVERAARDGWAGGGVEGLIVTRYGHAVPCERIEVVEAAHPVPDDAGLRAARRILSLVSSAGPDDLVLALISGGGSSLLALPANGLTLRDKQALSTALLRCGASISEMNVVRKHLSSVKGGRLAAAAFPGRTVGLLMSDVPGDEPGVIASGPTVGEASTAAQALAVLDSYGIDVPVSVRDHLLAASGCPRQGDPRLAATENHVIAAPQHSLRAAADAARSVGVTPVVLGDAIEGEAREVGTVLAGIAHQVHQYGELAPPPCVLLSGGETTVTVRGEGRGGRNVELLLGFALAAKGLPGVHALACDTDGVDGSEEVAGALVSPDTLARASVLGIDPAAALATNDGHTFFEKLGDQVITGPTLTNVNDFRAVLVT